MLDTLTSSSLRTTHSASDTTRLITARPSHLSPLPLSAWYISLPPPSHTQQSCLPALRPLLVTNHFGTPLLSPLDSSVFVRLFAVTALSASTPRHDLSICVLHSSRRTSRSMMQPLFALTSALVCGHSAALSVSSASLCSSQRQPSPTCTSPHSTWLWVRQHSMWARFRYTWQKYHPKLCTTTDS